MVIAILFVSFIYSMFLNVLYLSKRHIKTYETKMYSIMMIGNLIGIKFMASGLWVVNMKLKSMFTQLCHSLNQMEQYLQIK